jgi:hypothetical protein
MKTILNWIKNNPNRFMFLIPILLVAAISISHVVTWYDIANPLNWAIYLSIAIEIGAMTALVAATNKIKGGVWFMFGLVTFIQMIGNIFYSYKEIDETGELFKSWVELTGPIWEMMGTELTDVVGLKRYLAYLEGGLLPIISLTSLHFFVKYDKIEVEKPTDDEEYFKSRNKHIEKIVSEREEKEYNPMVEHPEDIYYPPKNSSVEHPLIDKKEDKEIVEVEHPLIDKKEDKESTDTTSDIKEVVINKSTVQQPIKPPKTNIQRID